MITLSRFAAMERPPLCQNRHYGETLPHPIGAPEREIASAAICLKRDNICGPLYRVIG
jgi:hypothetical protein